MTHHEIFEQLLLCWKEAERQLAAELLDNRNARDDVLNEEERDWREQWDRAE